MKLYELRWALGYKWFYLLVWLIRHSFRSKDRTKAYALYEVAMDFDHRDPRYGDHMAVDYVNRVDQGPALTARDYGWEPSAAEQQRAAYELWLADQKAKDAGV